MNFFHQRACYEAPSLVASSRFFRLAFFFIGLVSLNSCGNREPGSKAAPGDVTKMQLITETNTVSQAVHPPAPGAGDSAQKFAGSTLSPEDRLLEEALRACAQDELLPGLDKVNEALKAEPRNGSAYSIRGHIYTELKQWDKAQADYETALGINQADVAAKFNLSELKFIQKAYDDARPGFDALRNDLEFGDLAAYKVFLCDLFSGHEDVARQELDTFNKSGRNASYYFGNAAWCLFHHQNDEGRNWLASAGRIYRPAKIDAYTHSLRDLGYVPVLP